MHIHQVLRFMYDPFIDPLVSYLESCYEQLVAHETWATVGGNERVSINWVMLLLMPTLCVKDLYFSPQ